MKAFLRKTLLDKEITSLTADKTAYFLHATNAKTPYIEYQIVNEYGDEFAENKEIATTYSVQVDVFSKNDYQKIEDEVKEKMINAGFTRSSSADLYEENTGLYHKAMRFIYTKNIEE